MLDYGFRVKPLPFLVCNYQLLGVICYLRLARWL